MEQMKTFVCGDARIEAISKDGGMSISLDGSGLDLACLCAMTIDKLAVSLGVPTAEALAKVLMFLSAEKHEIGTTHTSIDVHRIQEAMRGG